jgi:hypothetical protein
MPITVTSAIALLVMGVLLQKSAPLQLASLAGREHGRTASEKVGTVHHSLAHTPSQIAQTKGAGLTEVVMNVQTGHHRGISSARLVHAEEIGNRVAQCLRPSSRRRTIDAVV